MLTIHLLPKYQLEFLLNLDGRYTCNSQRARRPAAQNHSIVTANPVGLRAKSVIW